MNLLHDRLQDYLALRRGLGFRLRETEAYLNNFCAFMERESATVITAPLALHWAMSCADARPTTWAGRLTVVRQFARYLQGFEPRTEIPEFRLLPFRPRRAVPYLYSEAEIERLLAATETLPARHWLRLRTMRTLVGLLAVTGLRLNEALGLKCEDVDLAGDLLTVRGSKFQKSRLIPLHPSTTAALTQYAADRDRALGERVRAPYFLLTSRGQRFATIEVYKCFHAMLRAEGLYTLPGRRRPRLHDLRHRFATETLLRWSRSGARIEAEMPTLATYLGHSNISDTYWYLSGHPELLRHAALRLDCRWGGSR